MGILEKIKEESKKSGQSKGKFIYFREGEKRRIRFLNDFESGIEITFHDSFEKGINVPCQELYGKDCKYCEMEGIRTRSLFVWSVWDYDAKDVKILMQAVNNCTAIPAIMALYEDYGTLLDRDLVITKTGKQQNTTYTVVPQDKNTFKNSKAKPLSKSAILQCIAKAYPDEDSEDDEDYGSKKAKGKKSPMNKPESDEDYEEMSARELYKLCDDRGIDVMPKKSERYYIKKLEEYDQANDDWGDEDEEEDDDWGEEEADYDSMSPKELYELCKEKGLAAKPKKNKQYYIDLLEEQDDNEEDDDEWEDE